MTRKMLTIDSPLIVSAAAFYQEAWQAEDAAIAPRFMRHSTFRDIVDSYSWTKKAI
jgi:hypothetical protein